MKTRTIAVFAVINIVGWLAAIYIMEHQPLYTVFTPPCTASKPTVWEKDWKRSDLWDWALVKGQQ